MVLAAAPLPTPAQLTLASMEALFTKYPVNSSWKLTLKGGDVVQGTVYCTDEASSTIILLQSLVHTTLASHVRVVNAKCIEGAEELPKPEDLPPPLSQPLPQVTKKALEDREKRAIKLAEESLRHINQKATPEGQAVFDRLVKACNEVVWKGESILVLGQIQVDPPYSAETCKIVVKGTKESLDQASLERVRKIVTDKSAVQ